MKDMIEGRSVLIQKILESMKTSYIPEAFIGNKDALAIAASNDLKSYYFGIEEDSFLFIDNVAVPLRKGSKLREGFNNMYDFEAMFDNLFLFHLHYSTYKLQTYGLFVHWERTVFHKYNGLKDEINCFFNNEYIQKNNKFSNGLKLKSFKSFFYLLIFGLTSSILLYIIEYLIVLRKKYLYS